MKVINLINDPVFQDNVDNYESHIKAFMAYSQSRLQLSITEVLNEYFSYLNTTNLAASTINCRRHAVLHRLRKVLRDKPYILSHEIEEEIRRINRSPQTKCPKQNRYPVGSESIISESDYNSLIHKARSDRQRRFLQFLWLSGARVSEMTGIRLSDINVSGTVATIRLRGKGNARQKFKERDVFVSTRVLEAIKATFQGSTYLFETSTGRRYSRSYVSNQIRKLGYYILGKHITPHYFRHSFATRMIQKTGRIDALSKYLGHSNPVYTMMSYSHDVFSMEDVI